MKTCPECLAEIPEAAAVCQACGRRIAGKTCPECAETVKPEAKRCYHCGFSFARSVQLAAFEPFSAQAALLPTFLFRGRLIPQQIQVTPERILIQTWGFLWLSRTDEDIPWEKIAGYHYHSGWFWDRVEIQTRGQSAHQIGCLRKGDGDQIKQLLERSRE